MRLILMTVILLSLTGCGSTHLMLGACAQVEPLERIKSEKIVPNKDGTLGPYNTRRAKRLVDKLRVSEEYFINGTTEVKEYNEAHKIF